MLIDGKKEEYNNLYELEIPKLYAEIKAKIANEVDYEPMRKRKRLTRPGINAQCELCPKEVYSMRVLKRHMLLEHTDSSLQMDKKKKSDETSPTGQLPVSPEKVK